MPSFFFHNPLDFLFLNETNRPTDTAYIYQDTCYSFAEIAQLVRKQAGWLKANSITKKSKVAIYCDDDLLVMTSIFAIWTIGAIAIPMNVSQTTDKLLQIAKTVSPDIALYHEKIALQDLLKCDCIAIQGETEFTGEVFVPYPDDKAIVMFTSGTSGVPKAVPMTYRSLGHNCYETARKLEITAVDRILINSPPYYTSAIVHNLTMFSHGASVVVDRSMLLANAIFDIIEKHGCTGFGGVPVHFARIKGCLEKAVKPKKLRFLMSSGEHLTTPLLLAVSKKLQDVKIFCVYGLTEVSGRLCILSPEDVEKKAGSVGFPLPGMEVSIRDAKGNRLTSGEQGEIFITGIALMEGYLSNDIANQNSMKGYGFATGDFGHLDEDGYLFIDGRADDIMKVGGEKVSLKMIEEAAFGFPAFKEIIVAPMHHELMGNVPCLYYVLQPDCSFKKKDLLKLLRQVLPANHIPAFFQKVDEIPRASSGKKIRSYFQRHQEKGFDS